MNENPYSPPEPSRQTDIDLRNSIEIEGITSTGLVREVKEHFDGRPNFLARHSVFIWTIPMILMAGLLIYFDIQKMPETLTPLDSIFAAAIARWYLILGIVLYIFTYAWVFRAQGNSDEIKQRYTFSNASLKVENENLAVEIPWRSVKLQKSDMCYVLIELAAPNCGEFVVDRTWCNNETEWVSLCQFLNAKLNSENVG